MWNGPYLKGDVPVDPWNHPYTYRSPSNRSGHDYDLCSNGPGGTAATAEADLQSLTFASRRPPLMPIPLLACMVATASYYHLPPRVLPSIQRVEGGHIGDVSRNTDGRKTSA